MSNRDLVKEHTVVLALIAFGEGTNRFPAEELAPNSDIWLYYRDLHIELYNRAIDSSELENIISYITWDEEERLLVEYVCKFDYHMLMTINSTPWLQPAKN